MQKEFVLQINGEITSLLATVSSIDELLMKVRKFYKTDDVIYLGMCEA